MGKTVKNDFLRVFCLEFCLGFLYSTFKACRFGYAGSSVVSRESWIMLFRLRVGVNTLKIWIK